MTPIEKVKFAEMQIIAIANGRLDRIDCPFCGTISTPAEFLLCCDELAEMADIILDRIETGESVTHAKEVADRAVHASHGRRNVSLN